jgi:AraC-like DNA-binding protein
MSLSGITLIVDIAYGATGQYGKVIRGFSGDGDLCALPYKVFYILAGLQIIILMIYLLYKLMRVLEKGYSSIFLTILMYNITTVVIIGIITTGFAVDHIGILKAGVCIAAILVLLVPIYGQRHPEFIQIIATEAEKRRYERSLLGGIDVDAVISAMGKLMEEERLYQEDTLTLKQMAVKVKITPHQLSELLNERMSCNFNTYINRFRIQGAEQLLKDDPDRSILSVSYEVGFNSKSSFYDAFLKCTGKTPQKYRQDILGKPDPVNR